MTALIAAAALRGTIVLALAWIVTSVLHRASADVRHRIWASALASLVLFLIPWRMPEAAQVMVFYSTASAGASAQVAAPAWSWEAAWAIGALALFAQFIARVGWLAHISRVAQRTEQADVRISESVASPMTWGLLRPVILLPAYSTEWTEEKRAYALLHERFHIRRADWLWQSMAALIRAAFWFHPLVWLAVSRMRAEAELAVDDAVIESGAASALYAEQLLDVARHMRTTSAIAAVSMVRTPKLASRIVAILDEHRRRGQASSRVRAAIFIAAMSVVPVLSAFQAGVLPPPSLPAFRAPTWEYPPSPVKFTPTPRPVLIAQATPPPAPPRQEPYPIGNGVSAPVVIERSQPQYTQEAKDARVEGEVRMTTVVDQDGFPTEITVTQGLGFGLDESAMSALSRWRFTPGLKDGVPVPVRATISVMFRLI